MLDTDDGIPNIPESSNAFERSPATNVQVGATEITVTPTATAITTGNVENLSLIHI